MLNQRALLIFTCLHSALHKIHKTLFNRVMHCGKQYRKETGLLHTEDFSQNRFGIRIFWHTTELAFATKSCYILAKPVLTASIEGSFQYRSCFSLYLSCMCRRLCFLFYFDTLRVCHVTHSPSFYSLAKISY